MKNEGESAKALQAIADALGTDVRTFHATVMADTAECVGPGIAGHDETAMLFRLIRLWRALPDLESRRAALRYIEALAARPLRAD